MINWNRCEDVMPDTVGDYLITHEIMGYQHIDIGYIEDEEFMVEDKFGDYNPVDATHWSPLNKPMQK